MQLALSAKAETIIERQVKSGKFATREAAVEASVIYINDASSAMTEQSRETLRRKLRAALEECRNGDSRTIEVASSGTEAKRRKH